MFGAVQGKVTELKVTWVGLGRLDKRKGLAFRVGKWSRTGQRWRWDGGSSMMTKGAFQWLV